MRTLLTLIGTGKYDPVRYLLDGRTSGETPYVQCALVELLDPRPDRIVILTTRESRDNCTKLMEGLSERGYTGDRVTAPEIGKGESEEELWAVFEKVGSVLQGTERVVFDATHAFRSLQLVTLLALAFYRRASDVKLERFVYGAFDARKENVAPVFDLTPMLALPDWVEAIAEWSRTGSARGLVELTREPAAALRRQLQAGDELTALVSALESLATALSIVRHDVFGRTAAAARNAAAKLATVGGAETRSPALLPLRSVAQLVEKSIDPDLACEPGKWREPDIPYLRTQLAAARFFARANRFSEAFAVARELLVSISVRIARAAGVEKIADWQPTHEKYRDRVDFVVRAACGAAKEPTMELPQVGRWLADRPRLAELLCIAHKGTHDNRNKLMHCWTSETHAAKMLDRNAVTKLIASLEEACGAVAQALSMLETKEAAAAATPARRLFVNLSNHPLTEWSDAQREAALAIAEELVDVPFPDVGPDVNERHVGELAERLLRDIPDACTHAMVMGEMTLTAMLVRKLQARGITCVAACGPRTAEQAPDGRKISRFEFHRFREYGC
jgi:hypothetical protein